MHNIHARNIALQYIGNLRDPQRVLKYEKHKKTLIGLNLPETRRNGNSGTPVCITYPSPGDTVAKQSP